MSYVLAGPKWGSTTGGTSGGQVTWSFATTTGEFYDFDYRISEAEYRALVRAAFDAWEAVADIDFVEVTDSPDSDIRLGWDYIDGTNGVLADATYYYFESQPFDAYMLAEIRFDTSETWSIDPNYVGAGANFYAVALHEIGHVIGLTHSPDPDTIMYAFVGSAVDLTPADIAGIQYIYGPAAIAPMIGTAAADVLRGSSGDDVIFGRAGDDVLIGMQGNDSMYGEGGDDALWAGAGDTGSDLLVGGIGDDTLGGGAGNDTLVGGSGSDHLFGGSGHDVIYAANQNSLTADAGPVTNIAWAGSGNDKIFGDNTNDLLGGGSGNDTINGHGGHDIIYGGKNTPSDPGNNDLLGGGSGNDTIYGGTGHDSIGGGAGNDLLFGGAGNDQVSGGAGADVIWGGAGNDTLAGGAGADLFGFVAGSGNDLISDFELGQDVLDLQGAARNFSSKLDVAAHASNVAGGLLIDLGDAATITLAGLTVADIDEIDYLL